MNSGLGQAADNNTTHPQVNANTLLRAAEDIRCLLERGYSRKSAIRFVSDHYQVNREGRILLSRTVFDTITAENRKSRIIPCDMIKNRQVFVDGFNVLFSVECAFLPEPIFLCDDGFLRDTRGATRSYRIADSTLRALDAIVSFFTRTKPSRAEFLFDAQVSKSGELSSMVAEKLSTCGIKGMSRTSKRVDFELKRARGIVATSDGIIVDEVTQVLNLPACIYRELKKKPKTLSETIWPKQ